MKNLLMKKWKLFAVLAAALGMIIAYSANVLADVSDPGSQADPLVTQSYVDNYVKLQVVTLTPGDKITFN